MKISPCSDRPVLVPCDLKDFEHQIDPYIGCEHNGHYCYVLDQAETDWTKEVLVYRDIAGQLAIELESLKPQSIYLGYHSDPYQPCEADRLQTRTVLEILLERGISASLLTKSDLVLRDADLLREMPRANVSVSVAFTDDIVRRRFEGCTIETQRRIDVLRDLKEAGIRTSAMICPVIPYITDVLALIDGLAPHTDVIRVYGLSVQGTQPRYWSNVQDVLSRYYSELKGDIEAAVFAGGHPYWVDLRERLEDVKVSQGLDLRIHV